MVDDYELHLLAQRLYRLRADVATIYQHLLEHDPKFDRPIKADDLVVPVEQMCTYIVGRLGGPTVEEYAALRAWLRAGVRVDDVGMTLLKAYDATAKTTRNFRDAVPFTERLSWPVEEAASLIAHSDRHLAAVMRATALGRPLRYSNAEERREP